MDGFTFIAPAAGRTAVIVEVPHAGLEIPAAVRNELLPPHDSLLRDADLMVDELYADAPREGAALLSATISRYVVDLNRAPDDVDLETVHDHPAPRRAQPRGVVWRVTGDGRPLLKRSLDYRTLQNRLSRYHEPYHRRLTVELERMRSEFGFALVVAAHSMPSTVRRGMREIERRADVVPGSLGRTSAHPALLDLVEAHFRAAGLSVRHDDPYRGGYTTAHYGRPTQGAHVVQIELNRALYMDELTCQRKPGDFERLRAVIAQLVRRLGALQRVDLA